MTIQNYELFLISDNVDISLIDYFNDNKPISCTINDFKNKDLTTNYYVIDVTDGVITKIKQIFTP